MDKNEQAWLEQLTAMAVSSSLVDSSLYAQYDVKRGLRDISGKGVLAGLTQIGEVQAQTQVGDSSMPGPGCLIYRGIDINEIVGGFLAEGREGFEETCYLLLFGELPDSEELARFKRLLAENRALPENFVHDAILKLSSRDVMNAIAQNVLALYVFDDRADDIDIQNVLRQCILLIATFPVLSAYSYRAYTYQYANKSLVIHSPNPELSTAANFLQQRGGGLAGHDGQDDDLASRCFHRAAFLLVQRVQRVIAAFHIDVRLGRGQKARRRLFREETNTADTLQRRQHSGAVVFGVHGPVRPFQLPHGRVSVQSHQQRVAQVARRFQIGDVSGMQNIETTIRDHEGSSGGAEGRAPGRQLLP